MVALLLLMCIAEEILSAAQALMTDDRICVQSELLACLVFGYFQVLQLAVALIGKG